MSPKLSAFCIDLAPNLSNEIRLVKIASDAGIYQAIITANEETDTTLLACVRQQRKKLKDTYFLSDVWAEQVIFWLLEVTLPLEQYNELKRTFSPGVMIMSPQELTRRLQRNQLISTLAQLLKSVHLYRYAAMACTNVRMRAIRIS